MGEPVNRRTFLAALGLSGATVVVSCSSDDGSSGSSGPESTNGAPATSSTTTIVAVPDAALASTPFTLGVASGDPLPDSVILWTRLMVDPAAADGGGAMGADPVDLKWEVASDEAFTTIVGSGIVTAEAAYGHSIHLEATGLEPDTEYWYRFSVATFVSPVGRARTMPEDSATPEQLRIGMASCQDFTEGFYPAHRAMATDRLDLVFFLGDFIYESKSSSSARQVPGGECQTLAEYRLRYATYSADADLQASRASCPWVVTWDDHEVENNYTDLVNDGGLDEAAFRLRRAAAYQAYYEHMPLRLDPPAGEDWRIFRTIRFGSLAEFFVLDGRQYRTDQACTSRADALVPVDSCPGLAEVARTMLGDEQESWLSDGLAASTTTWKVLAQQTVMSSLVFAGLILNVDQWDGYPAARQRLLGFIGDNDIDNVVVLTGDIHSAAAGELALVGADATRTPVAVEFVGTSITSGTLVDIVPGGADLITADKFPGVAYINVVNHGYGRCTVTPTEWRTEFVVVDTIATADAPARVDATCITPAGTPSVTRV